MLQQKKIPILHLDNSLRHVGLDPKEAFIRKTEEAVRHLLLLKEQHDFGNSVRLLSVFNKLKAWHLSSLFMLWFQLNKKRLLKNLLGNNPNLRQLDLYKLGYMIATHKKLEIRN